MAGPRTLLVVTPDPEGPVYRHRFAAYEQALAAAGIRLRAAAWPKRIGPRRRALRQAARASGVVISSRLITMRATRAFRRATTRLAFDFDDALPFRDSRRGATPSPTRRRRFDALIESADAVSAGNSYLAGLAGERGVHATLFPTTVRMPEEGIQPEPDDGLIRIGWIGSQSTLPYLEARALVFSALTAAGRPYRLRVIADRPPQFPPGIPHELVRWTLEGWQQALSDTHFCLAPLPDDPWARGKCGLKLLQSLSLGRPVVASEVGVQAEQVKHGETGFLAKDRESFLDGILALMDDGERRRAMGARGHEVAAAEWSVAAWTNRVVDYWRAFLDA